MKWIPSIAVIVLGVALILVPAPATPQPEPAPGINEPPVAICLTEEGGGRSTALAITSSVAGPGLITVFSGGETSDTAGFETGTSGSVTVPMDQISAVGSVSALVEFPAASSAAAAVVTGPTSLSAETCPRVPDSQVVLGGASTIEGREMLLILMNPYASEAVVDITAFSESGRETAEAFDAVIVPARSSVAIDVARVLPGRESLSLTLDITRGSVVAAARADVGGESAVWRPVAPQQSWFLPAPAFPGGTRELLIVSTNSPGVAYQIDVYGPNGLEDAVLEGVVSDRGQQVVDLDGIGVDVLAVRVVAEAPVGVFGRFQGPAALGMGAGSPVAAAEWLLPGAGSLAGAASSVAIANVGLEPTEVTVTELRDESSSMVVSIEPGQVLEVALDEVSSSGVRLISDGEIVPFWLTQLGTAVAVSSGTPIIDE